MAVQPIDDAALEQVQGEAMARAQAALARAVNLQAVLELFGNRYLPYGDEYFLVAPLPFELGAEIELIRLQLKDMPDEPTPAIVREERRLLRRLAGLFRQAVRPLGWRRQMLWPVTRNPFRRMSPQEAAELIGFFSACRARSRVGSFSRSGPSRPSTISTGTSSSGEPTEPPPAPGPSSAAGSST